MAARQCFHLTQKICKIPVGGVCWTKSELFLTKIRTANFDCRASRGRNKNFSAWAGKKEGGWGEACLPAGREFLPALAFAASFFAAAIFRANKVGAPPPLFYLTPFNLIQFVLQFLYLSFCISNVFFYVLNFHFYTTDWLCDIV